MEPGGPVLPEQMGAAGTTADKTATLGVRGYKQVDCGSYVGTDKAVFVTSSGGAVMVGAGDSTGTDYVQVAPESTQVRLPHSAILVSYKSTGW